MRDSFNEINITPLTDIFLVLLIIMMVIAPMLDQQGLNLAVPEVVNAEQVKQDSKIINIVVTSDNQFLWGNESIQSSDLEAFFTKHTKDFPDGLLIQADDNSEHGAIVRVMDSARNVGITSISLSRG
jgi:biopolymer transport protein ExbD